MKKRGRGRGGVRSDVDRAHSPQGRRGESTGCRSERLLFSSSNPLLVAPSQIHSLPFLPPFPQIPNLTPPVSINYYSRTSGLSQIMQWWDPARWTTSPYYALVVLVIACGGIPKGSFSFSFTYSFFSHLAVWLQRIVDLRSCEIMQVIFFSTAHTAPSFSFSSFPPRSSFFRFDHG